MSFDIKKHLQDHAYYFRQIKEITNSDLHFTFSFEDIQFFDKKEQPQEVLEQLLQELKEEAEYKLKDGFRVLKDGTKKQKYTFRKINLNKDIKIEAIHIIGSLGEHTHPHIHLILDNKGRYGKNFSILRLHISKISKKYGLIPHFDEIKEHKLKSLHDSVKRFFWLLKKKSSKELKEYFFKEKNKELLNTMLDRLEQYTIKTNNTLFYFKTLQSLQKRLKDNKINFTWRGHNLREVIPIENVLQDEDLEVIEIIKFKRFNQKDIKDYINNPILKDFARYCYYKNLNKCYVIKAIKETTIFQNIQPNSKFLNNFLKLYNKQNQTKKRKSQLTKEDNLAIWFKNKLLEVARISGNEKELRDNLLIKYNIQLKLKKRKGKVIGYTFIYESKEHYFNQDKIIKISELREILKNSSQIQTTKEIKYKKELKNEELQRAILSAIEFEQRIDDSEQQIDEAERDINSTEQNLKSRKRKANELEQRINDSKQSINRTEQSINKTEQDIESRKRRVGKALGKIRDGIKKFEEEISRGFKRIRDGIRRFKNKILSRKKTKSRGFGM